MPWQKRTGPFFLCSPLGVMLNLTPARPNFDASVKKSACELLFPARLTMMVVTTRLRSARRALCTSRSASEPPGGKKINESSNWAHVWRSCIVDDHSDAMSGFTLGDARSFSGLTSKIPPLGSMLNFDADAHHQREKSHSCKSACYGVQVKRARVE